MDILILAEDCNPDWLSIPAWTYQFICNLTNYANVTVATQIRNKPNIDRDGFSSAKVVFFDTEWIASPLHKFANASTAGSKIGRTLISALKYPSYLVFEWNVWKYFKSDLDQGKFDIVHRVSPLSPAIPSPLASLSPVPFVIGPINGGLKWPDDFRAELLREREWLSFYRNIHKYLPYYQSTYKSSACILAGFEHTTKDLPVAAHNKAINFPDVGLSPSLFNFPARLQREQMTILFVGRLVPYKLPEVVVRAFANSTVLKQHRLLVVGEGPEYERLEELIQVNHLSDCVTLTGKKTQAEVGVLMQQSEIFAFPSIRELGAGVVIEAMACGMACVVVDYGGPGSLIQEGLGIKVSLGNLNDLIDAFQKELELLVCDPAQVHRLGMAAHQHAIAHYTWDAKAKTVFEIYRWILDETNVKPVFTGIVP